MSPSLNVALSQPHGLAGAGFIEISQIARAIFGAKAYYAFGFLCLASALVGLTAALTTVLFAYFHLCAEDYRCVVCLFLFLSWASGLKVERR